MPSLQYVAVVVGGGPIGLTAALNLGQLGFDVSVYDNNSYHAKTCDQLTDFANRELDQRRNTQSLTVLSKRGIDSLKDAGFDFHKYFGEQYGIAQIGYLHNNKVSFVQQYFDKYSIFGVHEEELTSKLSTYITLTCQNIKQYQGYKLQNLDTGLRTLTFSNSFGENLKASYDLLIAADGPDSMVRSLLVQQVAGLRAVVSHQSLYLYKLFGPLEALNKDGILGQFQNDQKGMSLLHIDSSGNQDSKLTLWSNNDGTWCGMLQFLQFQLGQTESAHQVAKLIQRDFPNTFTHEWIQMLSQQASCNPSLSFGRIVHCNQLHGPHTILLGQAAHDMTQVTQQNLNAGLEDCSVMKQALIDTKNNVEIAPNTYTKLRVEDVHALQEIEGNFYVAQYKNEEVSLLQKIQSRFFTLPVVLTRYLASKFAWTRQFDVMHMLHGTNMPYSRILKYAKVLAVALLAGLSAGLLFALKLLIRLRRI